MRASGVLCLLAAAVVRPILAQTIQDIYQTTWDKTSLFSKVTQTTIPAFTTPGAIGSADIVVDETTKYQQMVGFGSTLTDSSAKLLSQLKTTNSVNYWALLNKLFSPTDGGTGAGLSYLRIPLGATDFSDGLWSFDGGAVDSTLANFNINAGPTYLFATILDILSVNSIMKLHAVPWSSPGWMKTPADMDGGTMNSGTSTVYAQYLLKCLQGLQGKGINVYGISIQNEPENNNPTYPSTALPVATEAAIGIALRTLMNNNGFSAVKLIGFEHNWGNAGAYPVQLMQAAASSFDGVSFHCYSGTVSQQDTFYTAYPAKDIWMTECTGSFGTDWWGDVKWGLDNLFIGAPQHHSKTAAMWNLALDGSGGPILPGSTSCSSAACRGVVTINTDGTYLLNQEFYTMAHASKAILPKDVGGAVGQLIQSTVGGSISWGLRVSAYETKRVSSSDWLRYSLVVLNWDDSASTTWNPQPIAATIEFRGLQAKYTFPVGVTTLWWFAAPSSTARRGLDEAFPEIHNSTTIPRTHSAKFNFV